MTFPTPQFPELGRCLTDKFAELLVEMAQVIKSAIEADIHNVQIRI